MTGYPPADHALRDWVLLQTNANWPYALLYSIFHVSQRKIAEIKKDRPQEKVDDEEGLCWIAGKFRQKMTKDQRFAFQNEYRTAFFEEVIQIAKVSPQEQDYSLDAEVSQQKQLNDVVASLSRIEHIQTKADEFCSFLSKSGNSSRPLVILALDEAHILTETDETNSRSKFVEFRSALFYLSHLPFFTLFLSTAGKFDLTSPQTELDPSARIIKKTRRTLPPIVETGFDQLALRCSEGASLEEVATDQFMAHLGRPLSVHHFRLIEFLLLIISLI